jgi:predicted ATP-grasp superfamily ATP-dependent carboligase
VKVLVTASRMPVALDEIRKLGRRGHHVLAADTFATAPGGRSRFVAERFDVAPPESAARAFVADVEQLIATRGVELLLPCFEEVFYLARHLDELRERTQIFASPLPLLRRLHDKSGFAALLAELGLDVPLTTRVENVEELQFAVAQHQRWVARPIWSRGGLEVAANAGPLAGLFPLAHARPTPSRPWIVQEFVDGRDVCCFSVAQHGRLVLHCTYEHPLEIEHRGGIVFESIDAPEIVRYVGRLVAAIGYHGQLGLDFRLNGRGPIAIECNPRPTAGVHLASDDAFESALLGPPPPSPIVVPAGRRRKYTSAVVRDLVLHPSRLRKDARWLVEGDDVYSEPGDRLPALYQLLSYAHVLAWRARHHISARGTGLMAAYFDGIEWNGDEIP